MIVSLGSISDRVRSPLHSAAAYAGHHTSMSRDFNRWVASLEPQVRLASLLFGAPAPDDAADLDAVNAFLVQIESRIGMTPGRRSFKYDRLNREQRAAHGMGELSRRQYNKRFRLAAHIEEKAARRARGILLRGLVLASKSRLASRLDWPQFSRDHLTACFIAYYVARCNLRSVFTSGSQVRPFDVACEQMMRELEGSATTNWFAIAHVMPDEAVVRRLSDDEKGRLLGRYYEMLIHVSDFLREVWDSSEIDAKTMIVRRGNDSSTWNLMAGAWNKLRDGWFALCDALNLWEMAQSQCFGKVMKLMAADVAAWHRADGGGLHVDTLVWAELPLPWRVLHGEETCTREQVEEVCRRLRVDPYKSGWLARRGEKKVEEVAPTPELVHGVAVSSPAMAQALRKAGAFSGKGFKAAGIDVDGIIDAAVAARGDHYDAQMNRKDQAGERST